MGKAYFIGINADKSIKLDIYYTDDFITPVLEISKIRLAAIEDIIAMKLEVINNGGRKKDFWDVHELKNDFSFSKMLQLHKERYPYNHNPKTIKLQFSNFEYADHEPDPVCLRNKVWEVIKLDMIDFAS